MSVVSSERPAAAQAGQHQLSGHALRVFAHGATTAVMLAGPAMTGGSSDESGDTAGHGV